VSFKEVLILGDDREAQVDTKYGENAATLMLLTTRTPVRIVGQIRGQEGTVTGTLMNALGRTAVASRNDLLSFMSNEAAVRRLKFGYSDIPVLIGNVEIQETGENERQYEVSFDFWQVGEYEVSSV
jgi:hypothetical protein